MPKKILMKRQEEILMELEEEPFKNSEKESSKISAAIEKAWDRFQIYMGNNNKSK